MDSKIVSAIIAGVVSIIVSLLTFLLTKHRLKSERQKLERELERKLTEKLYDKRIEAHPKAFSITQGLLGQIIENDDLKKEMVDKIRADLSMWISNDASFILSKQSLQAYYSLRDALLLEPKDGNQYSKEQRTTIWKAKNRFRSALRNDVNLLFKEDDRAKNKFN